MNVPTLGATVKASGVVYRDITAEFVTVSGSMISAFLALGSC